MDGHEIELKLAMAPDTLPRLKRLAALRELRAGPASTKSLRSVYYDTPDHRLARAGISARLRHGARGEVLQTVKTAGSRASGLFARREWEGAVAGECLDHGQLLATGLEPFGDDALRSALAPVFTTHIQRAIYHLRGDGWQVEMAVDTGEVQAGERRQPICEVELELKSGAPHHLFALARHIAAAVPVRLLVLSKSDRGYALAANREPRAVKAQATALEGNASVAGGFQAIARNCLHHLLANQDALLDKGDGEAVHQMRVALRRLRSAMKIFRPLVAGAELDRLRDEMRWLLNQLGPARDAEVFLAEIIDPVVATHCGQPGFDALRAHWQAELATDLAAARAAAGDSRFTALLLDLGAWVEAGEWRDTPLAHQPLEPFARDVLARLSRKLRKAGGKKLRRLPPPALHRVRIRGKQLRYAGEFFAALSGKDSRERLTLLSRLQDHLGAINDIAVAVPRLAACHHMGETAWAAGMVAGWHEARRPGLLVEAQDLWRQWRRMKL